MAERRLPRSEPVLETPDLLDTPEGETPASDVLLEASARIGGESVAPLTPTSGESAVVDPRQASLWSDALRQLRRNPLFLGASSVLLLLTLIAAIPQLFTRTDPRQCALSNSRKGPSSEAWFGYDTFGCDYYANVIYGARVSMIIGIAVIGGALVIGMVIGSLAGFYGGWFDSLTARLTDIIYGLPTILGAILLLNFLASAFGERGLLQVALALVLLSWMTIMRLIRSSVISVKETDYVSAARALGATNSRIITRHVLPNALAPVLVYSTIAVGGIIAAEATLSFLGIGLQLPAISWGLQINLAQKFIQTSPHLLLFPSIFLSVTVLSFILLGDALRDALDPKLR